MEKIKVEVFSEVTKQLMKNEKIGMNKLVCNYAWAGWDKSKTCCIYLHNIIMGSLLLHDSQSARSTLKS